MPANILDVFWFDDVPADISPAWRTFFEAMEQDMNSDAFLMGRSREMVRKERRMMKENLGLNNEFDAVFTAEAIKKRVCCSRLVAQSLWTLSPSTTRAILC